MTNHTSKSASYPGVPLMTLHVENAMAPTVTPSIGQKAASRRSVGGSHVSPYIRRPMLLAKLTSS